MSKTLTKRAERARVKSAAALGLFRTAAKQLEEASAEHQEVASTAGAVAEHHQNIQLDHEAQSAQAAKAAAKLREIVGGA